MPESVASLLVITGFKKDSPLPVMDHSRYMGVNGASCGEEESGGQVGFYRERLVTRKLGDSPRKVVQFQVKGTTARRALRGARYDSTFHMALANFW